MRAEGKCWENDTGTLCNGEEEREIFRGEGGNRTVNNEMTG